MRSRSGYAKVEPWTRRRIPAHTDTDHSGRPRRGRPLPPGEIHGIREYSARCDRRGREPARRDRQLVCRRELGRRSPDDSRRPAASDEVSALQAGVFSTYGQLYQTVSAEAQAIHQQFVNLLQSSSAPTKRPKRPTRPEPPRRRCPTRASSAASPRRNLHAAHHRPHHQPDVLPLQRIWHPARRSEQQPHPGAAR